MINSQIYSNLVTCKSFRPNGSAWPQILLSAEKAMEIKGTRRFSIQFDCDCDAYCREIMPLLLNSTASPSSLKLKSLFK